MQWGGAAQEPRSAVPGDRHARAVCLLYSSWEKKENIMTCKSVFWKGR